MTILKKFSGINLNIMNSINKNIFCLKLKIKMTYFYIIFIKKIKSD